MKLNKTIEIPTSYTTLIIGPDAKRVGNKDESIGAVIENIRRNNVNISNSGTLDTGGKKGVPVKTDGRSGGKLGVRGSVLVSTGRTARAGSFRENNRTNMVRLHTG